MKNTAFTKFHIELGAKMAPFAGYNIYKEAVYSKYLSYIPDFLWNHLTLPLANLIPDGI